MDERLTPIADTIKKIREASAKQRADIDCLEAEQIAKIIETYNALGVYL